MLERRVALLGVLRAALGEQRRARAHRRARTSCPRCTRSRSSPPATACRRSKLGTVSLIGPVRMDYAGAIRTVREAAVQLSRFVEDVYDPS